MLHKLYSKTIFGSTLLWIIMTGIVIGIVISKAAVLPTFTGTIPTLVINSNGTSTDTVDLDDYFSTNDEGQVCTYSAPNGFSGGTMTLDTDGTVDFLTSSSSNGYLTVNDTTNVLLLHGDGSNASTTITDSSLTQKTVTVAGNAQISTSQSKFGGSSMYFDGNGDNLSIAASADLSPGTQSFTYEFWYRTPSFADGTQQALMSYGTDQTFFVFARNGAGSFYDIHTRINTVEYDSSALSWAIDTWYHIAMTYDADTDKYIIFRDGINVTPGGYHTITNLNLNTSALPFNIGNAASTVYVNGYLDELRIIKGSALYTANFTPSTSAFADPGIISRIFDAGSSTSWITLAWTPIAPYLKNLPNSAGTETAYSAGNADMTNNVLNIHFNESTASNSTTHSDSSGQSHTATLTTDNTTNEKITTGKLSNAIDLDGSGDYLTIADHADFTFGSSDFSIEFWVKFDSVAGTDQVMDHWIGTGAYGAWTIFRNGTSLVYYISDNNTSWNVASATAIGTVAAGQWYHVALVRSSNVITGYLNSVAGTSTNYTGTMYDSSQSLYIGYRPSGPSDEYMDGIFDEVAIYKGEGLTATEVLDHYKRGALSLKYQVRSCDDSACSGESFVGPGTTVANSNISLDFDLADEGNYTQEDATNGTDFSSGLAQLHNTDPYTKMLIQGNGSNGDAISDVNSTPLTVGSSSTVNTTTKKYGTGSIVADGTANTKILANTSGYFSSGLSGHSWTLEMWLNPSVNGGNIGSFMASNYDTDYGAISLWRSGVDIKINVSTNGSSWDIANPHTVGSLANGVWGHLALAYDALNDTLSVYLDGTRTNYYTGITTFPDYRYLSLLNWRNLGEWNGYVDDLRLTVYDGTTVPQYSGATITVPASEFALNPYPTSQAYYVTTSASNSFSLSGVEAITSLSVTKTEPTNTTIKSLVSFDGRTTWKYYSSGWQTATGGLADLQTSGMTITALQNAFANWTPSGQTSLDFAFDLASTSSMATPSVDLITINYNTLSNTSGTYYSELNNSTTGLPSISLGSPVSNNRYFQYKTFFNTNNTTYLPGLSDVTITAGNGTYSDTDNTSSGFGGGSSTYLTYTPNVTTDTVSFRCTDTDGTATSNTVTVNLAAVPNAPTITAPTSLATGVALNPTATSSAYSGSSSHTGSDWQISDNNTFSNDCSDTNIVWCKLNDTSNLTSMVVNTTNGTFQNALNAQTALSSGTTYYIRTRHIDANGSSNWSTSIQFRTTNNGTFVSSQSGNWNIGTTWGETCTSSCVEGTDFPGASSIATVSLGHTVTAPSTVTANFTTLTVAGTLTANENISGTTLNISSGGALNLATTKTISATTINVTGNLGLTGNLGTVTNLNILNGGILTQNNTTQQVITGTLDVQLGAILTHGNNTSTQAYEVDFSAGTITIAGTVQGNSLGYDAQSGTGAGSTTVGAFHGGYGGYWNTSANLGTYGSITLPVLIGSGGGNTNLASGGKGGGFVSLVSSGNTTISGTVSTNGGNGGSTSGGDGYAGSGGSGGSVYVNATGNLTVDSGDILANGGNGGAANARFGGGGGGGRIALIYGGSYSNTGLLITTYGGTATDPAYNGGAGSIYIDGPADNGILIYDNNNGDGIGASLPVASHTISTLQISNAANLTIPTGATLTASQNIFSNIGTSGTLIIDGIFNPGNSTFTFPANMNVTFNAGSTLSTVSTGTINGNVTIKSGLTESFGDITIGNGGVLTMDSYTNASVAFGLNSLTINSGGLLTHSTNTTTLAHKIKIAAATATINTGGSINVNGKGYLGGQSLGVNGSGTNPGYGLGSASGSGGGAGHGGGGGAGGAGSAGGGIYDVMSAPVDLGAGGGAGNNSGALGGAGGGAVQISTSGLFTMNGNILANGGNGSVGGGHAGGGGAGGSVYLTVGSFGGTGTVNVSGGNGGNGTTSDGGGGSGGRASVSGAAFTGIFTLTGGLGPDTATDGMLGAFYPAGDFSSSNIAPSTSTPFIGNSVIYTATLSNSSDVDGTDVVFTMTPPSGTTYVTSSMKINNISKTDTSDSDECVYNSVTNTITVTMTEIVAGGSATLTFSLSVVAGQDHGTVISPTGIISTESGETEVSTDITVTGGRFTNVPTGLGVKLASDTNIDLSSTRKTGEQLVDFTKGSNSIAKFNVDLNAERALDGIDWDINTTSKKAFFHGFNDLAGVVDSNYTLYIPHTDGDSGATVRLCLGAESIDQIVAGCDELYTNVTGENVFSNGETWNGITCNINETTDEWECSGVSGTGGGEIPSTNNAPVSTTPAFVSQATDASGYITLTTAVSDADNNDTMLKVEYSEDGGTTWYDPYLVSATPSAGTVSFDNTQSYQIGATDLIDSSGGSKTLTIVWNTKSASNANGALSGDQSDIKIRVTANDGYVDGAATTSSAFEVDNAVPTTLASLAMSTSTVTTATLTWTAATETNFDHYEIWYDDVATIDRGVTDTEWDNSDDGTLATVTTSTTTITGFSENTTYYFKIWAVDDYGNETTIAEASGATLPSNNVPVVAIPSLISQATDGSGYITFTTQLSDLDNQDTKLKVEYSEDAGITWYDPYLISVNPNAGTVSLDNSQTYQIGTTDAVDSATGAKTLTIVWDSQSQYNGNGAIIGEQNDIELRVTGNDSIADSLAQSTTVFSIDNLAPQGVADFVVTADSATTLSFAWQSATSETNFNEYFLCYSINEIDVDENCTSGINWDSDDDSNLTNISANLTTINGLQEDTTYYIMLIAIDIFGNRTFSSIGGYNSNGIPVVSGVAAVQDTNGLHEVTITFSINDSDGDNTIGAAVEYFDGTAWNLPTLTSVTQSNSATADVEPSINNGSEYNLGDSDGYIHTSEGSNLITAVWDTDLDLSGTERSDIKIRVKATDTVDTTIYNESGEFIVDQVDPSQVVISLNSRTSTSLNLDWDAITETNFYRYLIYYANNQSTVDNESSNYLDQTDDASLTQMLTDNIEIDNLTENTIYYYKIVAYDLFGNASTSAISNSKTNYKAVVSDISALQRTDGSGIVDFSFNLNDADSDNIKLKVLYDLNEGAQAKTTINDNVIASGQSSDIGVGNGDDYQIGTLDNYIQSSSSDRLISAQWDSISDLSIEDDGYRICIMPNDLIEDGNELCSATFNIDNIMGITFNLLQVFTNTNNAMITLRWTVDIDETNFETYKIIYGENESDVQNSEGDIITLDSTDIEELSDIDTRNVDVNGFDLETDYYIKVIALDETANVSETAVANFEIQMIEDNIGGGGDLSVSKFFSKKSSLLNSSDSGDSDEDLSVIDSKNSDLNNSTEESINNNEAEEEEAISKTIKKNNEDNISTTNTDNTESTYNSSGTNDETKQKILAWKTKKSNAVDDSAESSQYLTSSKEEEIIWANEEINQFLNFLFNEGSISDDELNGRYVAAPEGAEDILLSEDKMFDSISRAELVYFITKLFDMEIFNAPGNQNLYIDVGTNHPYINILDTAIINDFAHGYGYAETDSDVIDYEDFATRYFKPDTIPTRAEALKIILRSLGEFPDDSDESDFNPFIDVLEDAWYLPYIIYSYKNNIIFGYSDQTFRPDQPINKAEFVSMLVHVMDYEALKTN